MHIYFYPKTTQEFNAATRLLENENFVHIPPIGTTTLSISITPDQNSFIWMDLDIKNVNNNAVVCTSLPKFHATVMAKIGWATVARSILKGKIDNDKE